MPFYYKIKKGDAKHERIASRLLSLKTGIRKEGIPRKNLDDSLLLATWNIREFDSKKHGKRDEECLYYIAEIISSFDLVAVQEIREDLTALKTVMDLLGSYWKYLITDVTLGTRGNMERMAYIYDSRKVAFKGLASEIVIPPIEEGKKTIAPSDQLYRSPYLAAFQSGWFKFCICTVHIVYGESIAASPEREKEIRAIAEILAKLQKENADFGDNMIILGDFNIFKPTDVTFKAITDAGFYVPQKLQKLPANALKNKHYDQIAFISEQQQLTIEEANAGVFDFYKYVYRLNDEAIYAPQIGKAYLQDSKGAAKTDAQKAQYYKDWRTYQMSDHLVMWLELKTDFCEDYLKLRAGGG